MSKELLVNVTRGEEVRVALVEDGRLEEIYLERDNAASNVGNIYLGKVQNVESSIQAAFVDFGYGRNGFLHVQDLHPDHFPKGGRWENMDERVGKKIGRRDRPPIQDALRRGDRIVVQIIKEGIGTKGPTLTSYPSIPGRFLVAMPGVGQMGVSKNIEDEKERRRLRKILDGLEPPKDVGFIIRTAGFGKTKAEIERDFKYLSRVWADIDKQRKAASRPALLYSEGDLVTRVVRDVYTSDVDRVVVDDVETALRIKQFFKLLMPRTKVDVRLYQGTVPLFHAAGVEHEIETMFGRTVPLPSGGSLVIDSTEAIVAIDVNSGKSRDAGDAEENAYRTDLEAADEICRQLRLRDLGGIVIADFIDLRYSRHRQALHDRLTDQFRRDKAKSRHLMMSEFGIVEITRQRMRPDLRKSVFMPCPWSRGTGYIKTPESMSLDVLRRLRVAVADDRVAGVTVRLYPNAAVHMLNGRRRAIADLEREMDVPIEVRPDDSLPADGIEIDCVDDRGTVVTVDALKGIEVEDVDQGHHRRRRRGGRGRSAKSDNGVQQAVEVDAEGLVELDDLMPLGDLKLEEVEALAKKAALDGEADNPLAGILDVLRNGGEGFAVDEDEEDEEEAQPEARTGRRRRRRSRDGEDETPQAEPSSREPEAEAPDDEDRPTGRRRRRRRRRGGDEGAGADATPPAAETEDEAEEVAEVEGEREVEGESTTGRRRRRRRRRGGGDEATEARPASAESPDEVEDEADAEAVAVEPTPAAVAEEDRPSGRRRRRRRRGGREDAAEDRAASTDAAEPADVEPDADEAIEAEPTPDAVAEAAEEARPSGRRRRRRRRRGGEDGPASEVAVEDDAAAEEPAAEAEAGGEAEDDAEARPSGRRRRRRRRDRDDAEAPADPEPAAEVQPEAEAEAEADEETDAPAAGRRGRRRRRRRGADAPPASPAEAEDATEEVEAPAEPDDDEGRELTDPRAIEAAVAAEAGSRVEPEVDPQTEPEADADDSEPESAARRPRRRRGKLVKSRPIVVPSAAPQAAPATEDSADADPPEAEPKAAPSRRKSPKKTAKAAKKTAKKATRKKAPAKKTSKKAPAADPG